MPKGEHKNSAPPLLGLTEKQLIEIQDFYTLAKELQWLSEETLEVDHIRSITR